jgi:hypothetical protein
MLPVPNAFSASPNDRTDVILLCVAITRLKTEEGRRVPPDAGTL